ncbi:MAG: LuxR C-terminal-related transcriptional regulator [Terracoccus sp.]
MVTCRHQRDVPARHASGGTYRSAAERLLVSGATVKTPLLHVYEKLGVGDRAAAVRVAHERHLL